MTTSQKNGHWVIAGSLLIMIFALPTRVFAQYPPTVHDTYLDGTHGFTIRGTAFNQFAELIAGLGDINGDGIDDFASSGFGLRWHPGCWCEPTSPIVQVVFGSRDLGRSPLWTVDELDGKIGFKIPEVGVETGFGAVSPAGDFSNDGIADFMVGASSVTYHTSGYAGACRIVYGRPGLGAEGTFDLATLDGSNGFTIYGDYSLAQIGSRMAAVKDFNGDGIDDILHGSLAYSGYRGRCYLVFGGTDIGASGEFSLADLSPETGIIINGVAPKYATGTAIASAGDVNGDGYYDIMIGTNKFSEIDEQGEAYVVFGGPDVAPNGVIELSELNGENGFVIRGAGTYIGGAGAQVAGFGDLNGDGYGDIAMSDMDSTTIRWIDVIFGGPNVGASGEVDAATLDGTNGFRMVNHPGETFIDVGKPKYVGDLNKDGINEILVHTGGNWYVWIIYGSERIADTGTLILDANHLDGKFMAHSTDKSEESAGVGDVNGDGIVDMAIGRRYEIDSHTEADFGRVDVLFGRRMGDVDLDDDIDLVDFQQWTTCMAGPTDGVPMIDGCQVFDFNHDGRVDLTDFGGFQQVFED